MYHGDERLWVAYAHHAWHTRARDPDRCVELRAETETEAMMKLAAALRDVGPTQIAPSTQAHGRAPPTIRALDRRLTLG